MKKINKITMINRMVVTFIKLHIIASYSRISRLFSLSDSNIRKLKISELLNRNIVTGGCAKGDPNFKYSTPA